MCGKCFAQTKTFLIEVDFLIWKKILFNLSHLEIFHKTRSKTFDGGHKTRKNLFSPEDNLKKQRWSLAAKFSIHELNGYLTN